jgi:hypothetical protein
MTIRLRELSREEYESTFSAPMLDVTTTAAEVVDLWEYADRAIREAFDASPSHEWVVGHVYEGSDQRHQHVLLPSSESNLYLVIVIDKPVRVIVGHHRLDLRSPYGLKA